MLSNRFLVIATTAVLLHVMDAVAQIPAELLGGGEVSQQALDRESFYKGPEGQWLTVRHPDQVKGLHCGVVYVGKDAVFVINGPLSPTLAAKNAGVVMFISKNIPQPSGKSNMVAVRIFSSAPPAKARVIHDAMGEFGVFSVPVKIAEMVKPSQNSESLGIEYEGKEVFRINVEEYNAARARLSKCMSAYVPPSKK